MIAPVAARWWHRLDDGRIQCDLCPRDCRLADGQRGFCFVRQRIGEQMVLTTYGRSSGFCVDPIEKKPLNHFYPGSSVLSFGTAGCNLGCRFCQNWDISKARAVDRLQDSATPEEIARRAAELGCRSVAFTYNDPVIFAEYALDVAEACHAHGIETVAVTAGYIHPEPRRDFYAQMDAANIDLKGFTEDFYSRLTLSHLAPVLDTLEYVKHHTRTWLEITTLLIPGHNDGDAELEALSKWVYQHLGPDVPLHFTAFHPDYKLTGRSHPEGHAAARAGAGAERGAALRLHRQRARRRRRHHHLSRVQDEAHRAGLVRDPRLPVDAGRALPEVRVPAPRSLRSEVGALRLAAYPGPARRPVLSLRLQGGRQHTAPPGFRSGLQSCGPTTPASARQPAPITH